VRREGVSWPDLPRHPRPGARVCWDWRVSIAKQVHVALGLSCPLCLLAVVVACAPGCVAFANSDALAAWWARAGLLSSSVLIIIAFVALAVLAIRRADMREVLRLEQIATFAAEMQGQSDRVLLTRRLIEAAQDLVPCQILPDEEPPPPDLSPAQPILFSLVDGSMVRIGGVMLRRCRGRYFSATEISRLRVLVAVGQSIDDKLRQNAKMEAIGRLTGGIAHDFNNLLTVILGNIEGLDLEPETGDIRDMHDQIRRAAQKAAELTRQLLTSARRQSFSPADVDIGPLGPAAKPAAKAFCPDDACGHGPSELGPALTGTIRK
jgi:signal transduction histidine kinase